MDVTQPPTPLPPPPPRTPPPKTPLGCCTKTRKTVGPSSRGPEGRREGAQCSLTKMEPLSAVTAMGNTSDGEGKASSSAPRGLQDSSPQWRKEGPKLGEGRRQTWSGPKTGLKPDDCSESRALSFPSFLSFPFSSRQKPYTPKS